MMNERDEREPDELDGQLRAIADHAVGLSRAASVTGEVVRPETRRRRPLVVIGAIACAAAVVAAIVVVANGDDDGTKVIAGASTTQPYAGPPEYRGNVTVLESPEHGPQLCMSVADSLPPQCGGPDIVGWNWAAVDAEESASGTTWGSFHVVGTWIDGVFALTRPATAPVPMPNRDIDFTTPCTELRTDDPDAVVTVNGPLAEESSEDFAGAWWDAQHGVYNVAFTGGIDTHEVALREQYDGRLCVVQFDYSESELLTAQDRLATISSRPIGVEISGIGIDTMGNRVSVDVLVADDATEAFVAQHLGDVAYVLHAALAPVEGSWSTYPELTTSSTDPPRYPNQEIDSAAAASDAWTASGIDDYTFNIEFQCRCALDPTTISVTEGVPDQSSSRDGDEFATIPALIGQIARAEQEATGEVEVVWGAYGIPEVVRIDWIKDAIDDEIGWTITGFRGTEARPHTAEEARSAWKAAGVADYMFRWTLSGCECLPFDVVVTVRDGKVVGVEGDGVDLEGIAAGTTMEQLIDDVAEATEVDVVFDEIGVPLVATFNRSAMPYDGGWIVTIADFERL